MKIAVVQFNPVLGALHLNVKRMLDFYHQADADGADLVIFPEMAITGYPIEDLAQSASFIEAASAAAEIEMIDGVRNGKAGVLFGCLFDNENGKKPSNGAILYDPVSNSTDCISKYELPNYGVFDEKRIFEEAQEIGPIIFRGKSLGVMICEDAWFPTVARTLMDFGADILISLNGSPFEKGKNATRVKIIEDRLTENLAKIPMETIPFVYVNMVGGQDELVFDGGSFIIHNDVLTQFPFFKETMEYSTVELTSEPWSRFPDLPKESGIAEIYQACVLGLRDYVLKQGFRFVVLGMSGGVDSGIVAALAVDALGANNVHLVRLPTKYSSQGSLDDADAANTKLGTKMRTINIEPVVSGLRAAYAATNFNGWEPEMLPTLTGVADENIQARARGNILMAISNQEGHLLLTTGNKSEVSVGYSTLYGDMAGGFNPIKDCYKTTVWAMCRYRNALTSEEIKANGFLGPEGEIIPESIIVKPPSAELRPDQQDSDSLPPYEVLDEILMGLVEKNLSINAIVAEGFERETVERIRILLDRAEYKRRQAAPGIKITSKLHGRERRVPIVNHFTPTEEAVRVCP